MNVSVKRIQAIFLKDYKEFIRNYAISVMVLFPIIFAYFYRSDSEYATFFYGFTMNMSLGLVTSFVQACLIAEEKERNTLRTLMMTPASMFDILIGKSVLVFLISAVTFAVATFIFGFAPANMLVLVVALALSIILYIALGTICGLFSKSVLESTLAVMPVMLIFTGGPFLLNIDSDFFLLKAATYLPSTQFLELIDLLQANAAINDMWQAVIIIFIWAVAMTILSFILYKKRLVDE